MRTKKANRRDLEGRKISKFDPTDCTLSLDNGKIVFFSVIETETGYQIEASVIYTGRIKYRRKGEPNGQV